MTPMQHIQAALDHIRQAAQKRGVELDDVMRALCLAHTELAAAGRELARQRQAKEAA